MRLTVYLVVSRVQWVRYIQWAINAPLIIILVLLASGLALSDIFLAAFMALAIVIMGLVGGLTASSYKWGYFVFGLIALFYVMCVFSFFTLPYNSP